MSVINSSMALSSLNWDFLNNQLFSLDSDRKPFIWCSSVTQVLTIILVPDDYQMEDFLVLQYAAKY